MVIFISGTMFGGKSKFLIDVINDCIESDELWVAYKPTIDTRDGLQIRSRDYEYGITAFPWNPADDSRISNFRTMVMLLGNMSKDATVFFDEVHFMSLEDVKEIVSICNHFNVAVVFAGLETDFKKQFFPSSHWLKDESDAYMFLSGKCYNCGSQDAIYNVRFDDKGNITTEGESIVVGDSEYKVACMNCY